MGRFIFISFGLLVVFFFLSGAKGSTCPFHWLPMYGLCYKIFDKLKTWNDAEMFCRKYKPGCHLASLHSKRDSIEFAEYISDYRKGWGNVWIGMWGRKEGLTCEWTDGSSTTYVAWKQNLTDHYLNKDLFCAEIVSYTGYRLWNKQDCKVKNAFLCQCGF
uniref:C-type lectin 1 n=1 Tax=Bitis gabonica TaxID=8694 RepID=LEC1_BITGA|nr:RecName: Full=C-type lectin 1; Short=CTL; Flags: Precursor [Bitis gabonica]AAR06851.1 C-type lectin-1 [Bitis gabonica]